MARGRRHKRSWGPANARRSPDAIYQPYPTWDAATSFAAHAGRGNGVRFACWDCGHASDLSGRALVERFGGDATLVQLFPRLKCSGCGVGRVHTYSVGVGSR